MHWEAPLSAPRKPRSDLASRDQPRTPEKPPEAGASAGVEDPDDTPPKGAYPAPRRAVRRGPWGVPTPHVNAACGRARLHAQKEQATKATASAPVQYAGRTSGYGENAAARGTPEASEALPPPKAVARNTKTSSSTAKDALREFSVSAPRYGSPAAALSFEELPPQTRHALNFIRSIPMMPCTNPSSKRPFLPSLQPDVPRHTLVLDLDETLAHCSRGEGRQRHGVSTPTGPPDLVVEFDDNPAQGNVFFRPFVHFFLEVAAKSFELVVFTASQQAYADKVINALDPTGSRISHRLYRQHCTEFRGAYFKELSLLGRPLSQCFLVDNSPISIACNADHGILIRSWYGDRNDQELMDLLTVLQELRVHGGDAGKFLADRYGLFDFFEGMRRESTSARP